MGRRVDTINIFHSVASLGCWTATPVDGAEGTQGHLRAT